jgi:S1-C subfamily serine protease
MAARDFHAIVALALLTVNTLAAAEARVDVGMDPLWRFQVLVDSIVRDGSKVRYRVAATPNHEFTRGQAIVTDVEADCASRRRMEVASARRFRDGQIVRRSAADLGSGGSSARVVSELGLVCKLAADNPPQTTAETVPAPRPGVQSRGDINATGSGFVVGDGSHLITNYHVISSCRQVQVHIAGVLQPTTLEAHDRDVDLALLRINQKLAPLDVAGEVGELGQAISVLGYPLAAILSTDIKVTTGVISSLSGPMSEQRLFQISASIQAGNSGGPVLDQSGAVVGVTVSKLARRFGAENVNFAITASELRRFLQLHRVDNASSARTQMSTSQVVKLAAPSVLLVVCLN